MESTLLIRRREAIILETIDAINETGVQAISTKEIAKKMGVSERVIFNHFPKKNDLLVAVLDYFTKYDNAIIQTIDNKKMKPIEAITYFFEAYSTYYENYPAITSITQSYDALQRNPELSSKIIAIFDNSSIFISKQIENAKELQIINPDIVSEAFADVLIGTFIRLCLKWRMHDYNFSLKDKTLSTLQFILKNINNQ